MKVFLVGGAVRDEIMGVESKDRDYVVVGSTHEEMIAAGFEQVGAAFPVYLDPDTKEEYALARTERSTGPGYHDFEVVFSPDVTIEQDLARRDLTINAIAKDLDTGEYIDPLGGIKDIENKVLRATHSKIMLEDPLRVYRLARLLARFGGEFKIEYSTLGVCYVASNHLIALPKERKMAEIRKCFEDKSWRNKPSLMIDMLAGLGELPEVAALKGALQPEAHHPEGDAYVHTLLCLDHGQIMLADPDVKWAVLCHDLGKVQFFTRGNLHGHEAGGLPHVRSLNERFGVPNKWADLALRVCEDHTRLHRIEDMGAKKVYELLVKARANKDNEFANKFVQACICDARGRGPTKLLDVYLPAEVFWACAVEFQNNRAKISEQCREIAERFKGRPELVAEHVKKLKVGYVARALSRVKSEIKQKGLTK